MNTSVLNQILPDILNYAIIIAIIVFGVHKTKLYEKFEILKNNIKSYVENSEEDKNSSIEALKNANEQINNLPSEIQDIENSANKSIKGFKKKTEHEIEVRKNDLKTNANRILSLEEKDFKQRLTKLLAQTSIKLARENAIEQLNADKNLHNEYINQAIEELDRIEL